VTSPPINQPRWAHPDANPIQDIHDLLTRAAAEPTTFTPPVIPDWLQRRYRVDVWGNPL
jgi:hypothetical protein